MSEELIASVAKAFSYTFRFLRENSPGMRILLKIVGNELNAYEDEELAWIIVRDPERFYMALLNVLGSRIVTNAYAYIIMNTFFRRVNVKASMFKVSTAIHRGSMEMWRRLMREVMDKISGEG